ncbi:hypothetical protein ACFRDV_40535 [Streptomyces fagopyri]
MSTPDSVKARQSLRLPGSGETLNVTLVEPDLIVEVGTDIAHSEPAVVP